MPICKKNRNILILSIFLMLSLGFVQGCKKGSDSAGGKDGAGKKGAAPVVVAEALTKDVPVQITAVGNIQALSTVSIKSQVEGEIASVYFKEGQEVKAGDPLFGIDARMYEAQLRQAEASLAKNKAQLVNTKKQLERYASVLRKGITEEQYDNLSANAASLEASIKSDESMIDAAKLRVSYCSIKAPVPGVTGSLKVSKGNIVKANDNDRPLVTINQIKPIYAVFSVPEKNLTEIRKLMAEKKLEVTAQLSDQMSGRVSSKDIKPVKGSLAFIENSVDVATGTIQMKASFPNEDAGLWPGQFVNITLGLGIKSGAVTVPSQAILSGQKGEYVLVVKEDETVDFRIVKPGSTINGETVINEGVTAGEKVVTDGQMKIAPGAKVKIADAKEASDKKDDGKKKPEADKPK
ncbi:efflux RND transporter periplasmic adaptor subunit [Desulforegula conservatrix]|uniref:efflux RND transporter periplasmic adaptor subunit n=1 Tax=Desulforegula conservatrix TaxID=153026 RepID=UPI000415474A|nr:efflux RND transporter periplasmic adaptor subunit [Desulforegula conservatrix]